jgi:hypothetical protein
MLVRSLDIKLRDRAVGLLLADLQEHDTPGALSEHLYVRSRNEITVADALIIRPAVDQPVSDLGPIVASLSVVFERVPRLPAYLLTSFAFRHTLSSNVHADVDDIFSEDERRDLIPILRQTELTEIARESRALMRADSATIFRTPSKSYCYTFVRAGNVQLTRHTLDIFFFWMLPWLEDCHAILAETWTISSIVLNATRLMARYAPSQGRCKVEMLCDYYDRSALAEAAAENVLRRLLYGTKGRILVVFSACMTGRAVSGLRDVVQRHLQPEVSCLFGALYNLADGLAIECLCELFKEVPPDTFQHHTKVPIRGKELIVVDIDRATYFPAAVKQMEVSVDRPAARHAEQFFKDYGHLDVFSVHRDSYVAGQRFRHRAIYPDVSALLQNDRFQRRLKEKTIALDVPPSLVVAPPHDVGRELARFCAEFLQSQLNREVPVFEHLDLTFQRSLSSSDAHLRDALLAIEESAAILIVDDVSVSGNRLARYQRSLRDLRYRGQIHYLVGLARPKRLEDWESRTKKLRFREGGRRQNTLGYVEVIVLPDWDDELCPWCAEQKLYADIVFKERELPPILARRAARLADTRNGLKGSEIFACHLPGFEFRLGQNSIFAPAGCAPAAVFAAISSALQRLRTDPTASRTLNRRLYPQRNCICADDYLGNTFTDPILRACFLRSAYRHELEKMAGEDELERAAAAKRILVDPDPPEHGLAAELALAIALQKLPPITITEAEYKLPYLAGVSDILVALRQ